MKDLIFGAAYYEEYAQEDRLERDMALMREAGMNTIRIAESTWSVEEPRCGEFDFSHVTRVIEAAGKYGINVIIGTPTYAIPSWLAALDPEIPSGLARIWILPTRPIVSTRSGSSGSLCPARYPTLM